MDADTKSPYVKPTVTEEASLTGVTLNSPGPT